MVRWAKCDKENDRIIAESRTKTNQSERYTAVNLTNKTIEIRVFRGTLNANSFHKNLEFCHAVYYYTKNCSNQNVSVAEFVNWVQGKKEYKNLADFISAKFEERFLKCA